MGLVGFFSSQQPPQNYRPKMYLGRKVIWANLLLEAGVIKPFQGLSRQRAYIPESGCLTGQHRRLPTSPQTVSQWLTCFLRLLKAAAGWDRVMLMGSPTSNVGAWRGRWKRNKAESRSVSSWSSEERRKAAATCKPQQPTARRSTDTKSLCEETDSSSPNPMSSRVQTTFHKARLSLPSSLPHFRAALRMVPVAGQHVYPHMSQKDIDSSGG